MTKLTRKGVKFEWTKECQTGFEYLKACLMEAMILSYHNPSKQYVVFMDALGQAVAAILMQENTKDGETKEIKCLPFHAVLWYPIQIEHCGQGKAYNLLHSQEVETLP